MKKTVYIHIGTGKTGTSAIQSFMLYNRKKLAKEYSCLYPNFSDFFPLDGTPHNHVHVFKNRSPDAILASLRAMREYSEKKQYHNIVLSWEALFDRPGYADLLLRAVGDQEETRCVIIAYVRRPDHWYESAWKEWGVRNKKYQDIEEYIQKKPLKWDDRLQKWADVFGKENMVVHAYEKEQLPHGLIDDFLGILKIDYQGNAWIEPPGEKKNANYGFNRDVVEILRLNREFYSRTSDNRLVNFFSDYLDDSFKKKPFEFYSLLSPAQRMAILEKNEPMTRRIARDFLGRDDGRLFYEKLPDVNASWEPYPGLSVEAIVPIFTQVLYNMQRENQGQRFFTYSWIRDTMRQYLQKISILKDRKTKKEKR